MARAPSITRSEGAAGRALAIPPQRQTGVWEPCGREEICRFLGNHCVTSTPEVGDDHGLVLEIEVDGAQQVKKVAPEAMLIFVKPPSRLADPVVVNDDLETTIDAMLAIIDAVRPPA